MLTKKTYYVCGREMKTKFKECCELCRSKKKKLTVHHVYGGKKKHRIEKYLQLWEKEEKVWLCRECHDTVHNLKKKKSWNQEAVEEAIHNQSQNINSDTY